MIIGAGMIKQLPDKMAEFVSCYSSSGGCGCSSWTHGSLSDISTAAPDEFFKNCGIEAMRVSVSVRSSWKSSRSSNNQASPRIGKEQIAQMVLI